MALAGIARPVAYCEVDEVCRGILARKMLAGVLPKRKVFEDVKSLRGKDVGAIDIIVGGWPCQDLSMMGKRKGLAGARSGLIYEVLRLTDELKPKFLFLENVPPLVVNGLGEVVKEFVDKRGYELRWAVVPAAALGAPHSRRRWYGLLVRKDLLKGESGGLVKWKLDKKPYKWFDWGKGEPRGMQRMVVPRSIEEKQTMLDYVSRLGNSVVPDAVRAAFMLLVSGFALSVDSSIKNVKRLELAGRIGGGVHLNNDDSRYGTWGMASPRHGVVNIKPQTMKSPALNLVFDPKAYVSPRGAVGNVTSGLLKRAVKGQSWSTPRFTVPMCNVLTVRSVRDLPTQVRFERGTADRVRGGIINPAFVEWLMAAGSRWS